MAERSGRQGARAAVSVLHLVPGGLERGGGIGRMVGYVLEAQSEQGGVRAKVVDTRGPGRIYLALFWFAFALGRVLASAMTDRPLLHIHLAGRGSTLRKLIVAELGGRLGLPLVLHLHDYDYAGFFSQLPPVAQKAVARMFKRAGAVVVLGTGDRRLAETILGCDPSRVFVLANAVPDPGPLPAGAGRSATALILFLGDPSPRKGVQDLLAALAHPALQARRASWRAVVAGGGPHVDRFAAEAAALGLSDHVTFPGWLGREAVRALLADADLLVLPSYAEGQAMSVLEAMAAGRCVICTPVGALAEAVEPDRSGLIVPPGDVEALAGALERCLNAPELRASLGVAARRRFEEAFDVRRYPERLRPVYARAAIRA